MKTVDDARERTCIHPKNVVGRLQRFADLGWKPLQKIFSVMGCSIPYIGAESLVLGEAASSSSRRKASRRKGKQAEGKKSKQKQMLSGLRRLWGSTPP